MSNHQQAYRWGRISLLLCAAAALWACQTTQPLVAVPQYSLMFRGTDGLVHARWSADGLSWQDPTSFPPGFSISNGPGQSGIPTGLSQLAVVKRGSRLFRMAAIGASEYGSSPPETLEDNVSVDSAVSVAFIGSGNWLLAHRSGGDGVLKRFDGSNPPAVVTPPGLLTDLCTPDSLSGPIGPRLMILGSRLLIGFCRRDAAGNESIRLVSAPLDPSGTPNFASATETGFQAQEVGFQVPRAKTFALAHDGSSFLLATVAPEAQQPGPLTSFGLMVYASSDGVSWSLRTLTSRGQGLQLSARPSTLGIAAHPAGRIVVAQAAGQQPPQVWTFDGSAWSNITGNSPFGAAQLDPTHEFSLRLNSQP